ncbi:hypothetical protein COO60DRAFT_1508650 [Scenedesmus sp. NREL 46B-D3]|nr:hypothetical protein COO60DRAFT_1508650 [Scenedesmus sp. NREL 46B-D3]
MNEAFAGLDLSGVDVGTLLSIVTYHFCLDTQPWKLVYTPFTFPTRRNPCITLLGRTTNRLDLQLTFKQQSRGLINTPRRWCGNQLQLQHLSASVQQPAVALCSCPTGLASTHWPSMRHQRVVMWVFTAMIAGVSLLPASLPIRCCSTRSWCALPARPAGLATLLMLLLATAQHRSTRQQALLWLTSLSRCMLHMQ